jgi:hypothetical protein
MTPSGIEPATFRFVAQCLKQQRHRVPLFFPRLVCFTNEPILQHCTRSEVNSFCTVSDMVCLFDICNLVHLPNVYLVTVIVVPRLVYLATRYSRCYVTCLLVKEITSASLEVMGKLTMAIPLTRVTFTDVIGNRTGGKYL